MKFFIVCPRGLEIPLAEELKEISERSEVKALGAWVIDPPPLNNTGGLGVAGPMSVALAINLHSRIASRCLLQMTHVAYRKEDDIYKAARSLSWEDWITPDQTMRVDLTAHRFTTHQLELCHPQNQRCGVRSFKRSQRRSPQYRY